MASKYRRRYNNRRAFSLLEVIITLAILSAGIVFILRAFSASLYAAKFSQNITLACLLAEEKLWEIQEKQGGQEFLPAQNKETMQGRDFNWSYEAAKLEDSELTELKFNVSWRESAREKEYTLKFLADLYMPGAPQ